MNSLKAFCIVALTALVTGCWFNSSSLAQATQTNVFHWEKRPQLTAEQQKMLGLEKSSQLAAENSPVRAERRGELAAWQKKLGPLAVRYAKPNELIMSLVGTNVCSIHNPTAEGVVLTVAIVGDVEQHGTRMASIGRQAYFPPGATIIVTNLYWTSPATAKRPA